MSLVTLGVWIVAFLGFMTGLWVILPDASAYPFPDEFETGITTLYGYLYNLNTIAPVYETILVVTVIIALESAVFIIWPIVLWVIRTVSGIGK